MSYEVTKTQKGWELFRNAPGWSCSIGTYPTRKAAVLAGRLLAGWRGSVTVTKLPRKD